MRTSSSGPTGRPVAMLTFAFDRLAHGLDPWWMKVVNLVIHILNGFLLYRLLGHIVPKVGADLSADRRRLVMALLTTLWLAHPLHVSTVLYVVQRMTLLSASFMLLGLLGYCHFRDRSRPQILKALGSLAGCTLVATFAKENGVLALGYAALIEILIFRFHGLDVAARRLLRLIFVWSPLGGAVGLTLYWLGNPDWFTHAYAHRDFSLTERLLTEARALAFYQRLIVAPDLSVMGLYHDDFPLSHSLLTPPTTLAAILWHILLLGAAWALRKRLPAFSFGILWFYVSHSIESTILPLELVFEHRNYLAVAGLLIAVHGLLDGLLHASGSRRTLPWLLGGLTAGFMAATAVRAADWGDFYGHALMEANRHPGSARSQFEAAQTLARGMSRNPKMVVYYERARDYYWASAKLAPRSIASLVSLLNMDAAVAHRVDPAVLAELRHRLRHAKPLASMGLNLHALIRQILEDDHQVFAKADALSLFDAALANPNLGARHRAEVLVGKALYLHGENASLSKIIALMREATNLRPQNASYWLLLAGFQIDAGRLEEASQSLDNAERCDPYHVLRQNIANLRRKLSL